MSHEDPVVSTRSGPVRGVVEGAVLTWRGVPYAAPPTGPRRFRRPEAPEPWTAPLEATAFGPSPVQPAIPQLLGGPGRTERSEDCLTLNVTRPAADAGRPRPVLVWIYGGGFLYGASRAYDAAELAERADLVVVTLNYRVGAFGFLDLSRYATDAHPFDANNGLRDQVAALAWVQGNIAAFGGDPDQVTVFGESAGAISVCALMCVPAARGLFHRAIAESASPSATFDPEHARGWAREFVRFLSVPEEDLDAAGNTAARDPAAEGACDRIARRLHDATVDELRAASERLSKDVDDHPEGTLAFAPVVDGEFLTDRPLEVFRRGAQLRVPLVIGTNANEGAVFAVLERLGLPSPLPTREEGIERAFEMVDPGARDRVLSAYPDYPSLRSLAQVAGDVAFWYPSIQAADAHSSVAPTWVYRFDYVPRSFRLLGLRAAHGLEVPFVFGQAAADGGVLSRLPGRQEAARVSERVIGRWGAFAHGNAPGAHWPRYDARTRPALIIDRDDRVEHDPRAEQRRAWEASAFWD